jgi:hypothetical protein
VPCSRWCERQQKVMMRPSWWIYVIDLCLGFSSLIGSNESNPNFNAWTHSTGTYLSGELYRHLQELRRSHSCPLQNPETQCLGHCRPHHDRLLSPWVFSAATRNGHKAIIDRPFFLLKSLSSSLSISQGIFISIPTIQSWLNTHPRISSSLEELVRCNWID